MKQFQLIILFIKFDVRKTLKKRWKRDKFAYACALYSRKSRKKLLNIGMHILFEPLLRHYIIKVDIFFLSSLIHLKLLNVVFLTDFSVMLQLITPTGLVFLLQQIFDCFYWKKWNLGVIPINFVILGKKIRSRSHLPHLSKLRNFFWKNMSKFRANNHFWFVLIFCSRFKKKKKERKKISVTFAINAIENWLA